MVVPITETVHFDVVTSDPSTGAAIDADSAPTFEVFEEATDTDIGGGTTTKRSGRTGNYRGSVAVTAGAGFEVGKYYSVVASATVGGVTGKAVVMVFRVVAAEGAAGYPKVDIQYANGVERGSTFNNLLTDYGLDSKFNVQVVGMDNEVIAAAAIKADAVTKMQAGLAAEADLILASGTVAAAPASTTTLVRVGDITSGPLAANGVLNDHLIVVSDSDGTLTQARWITSHAYSGGTQQAYLNLDSDLSFTPTNPDTVKIYAIARYQAKVATINSDAISAAALASDAVAEIEAAVSAQITTDHGAGSYARNTEPLDAAGVRSAVGLAAADLDDQLDGLSGDIGDVNVTVTPLAITVSAGEVSGPDLIAYQYCGFSFLLTITDDNGDPIDLEGKTINFVVHDLDSPTAEVFELTTGSGVTVVGAEHNQLAIAGTSAKTQTAGSFRWFAKDVTDVTSPVPLGDGSFSIRETPADA